MAATAGGFVMNMEEKLLLNNYLETERLYLRPVTIEDAEDMYEYTSDPETVKYMFEVHHNLDDTKREILNYFVKEPIGKWGVVLKKTGKFIGNAEMHIDTHNLSAEIGYAIGRKFWGNGYAPEAATQILELGFAEMGLKRIYALYCVDNKKSGRVLEKIGMQKEGVLRNHSQLEGKTVNDGLYAMTDEDWQKLRKMGEAF